MNPGMGNALAAIGRITDRIEEIGGKFDRSPTSTGFQKAMDKVGGIVESKVQAPPVTETVGPHAKGGTAGGTANYKDMISDASARHGVDPALVRAVMAAESGGNPKATSPVGAMGLMQLMPGTAAGLGVDNAYDPAQNVEGGAKYLADLTRKFGVEKGVAAYNAGPGAVEKYGGVPPYKETQGYVDRVMGLYGAFSKEKQR